MCHKNNKQPLDSHFSKNEKKKFLAGDRNRVVDFSIPYSSSTVKIVSRAPQKQNDIGAVVLPFQAPVSHN